MKSKRRPMNRPLGQKRYKRLFVIGVEGYKTEPQYFSIFNHLQSAIQVKCLKSDHKSSAKQVLKKMEGHLKEERLRKSDQAWLVVDKDQNSEADLKTLFEWSKRQENYGFALSNPNFEYWLLLHFEEGKGICSARDCADRLKQYLSDYDKGIDRQKLTPAHIQIAIDRARKQAKNLSFAEHLSSARSTTVYRLAEVLLEKQR